MVLPRVQVHRGLRRCQMTVFATLVARLYLVSAPDSVQEDQSGMERLLNFSYGGSDVRHKTL